MRRQHRGGAQGPVKGVPLITHYRRPPATSRQRAGQPEKLVQCHVEPHLCSLPLCFCPVRRQAWLEWVELCPPKRHVEVLLN